MSTGAIVGAWPVNRGNLSEAVLTQRTNTGPQVDGTPSMPSDQWQPKDADLSALAALTGAGLAVRTGADAWALRTLTLSTEADALLALTNPAGTAGNPTFDLDTQSANRVFAGPATGTAAKPAFRALVAADIPDLSASYQPLDADLTAIAALTTTAYGRSFLTQAAAVNARSYVGLGTTDTPQFARLGLGGAADASTLLSLFLQPTTQGPFTASALYGSGADGAAFTALTGDSYGNGCFGTYRRANGTAASPSALSASDVIFRFAGRGYGATGYSAGGRVAFDLAAAEAWTDTAQGTAIILSTTLAGTVVLSERVRVSGNGNMLVGTASDTGITGSGALKVNNALMIATGTSFGNGAAAAGGTLTNAPAAGNPTKWIPIYDNGTTRYIPAW